MSKIVNNWCRDAQGAEYGFFKAVVHALEAFNDGDGNALGKLMCVTHGKTCKRIKRKEVERLHFATPLKRILEHTLAGVEYKFDKNADFGVVFKRGDNGGACLERIEALRVLGSQTVKSDAFKKTFPAIKKVSKGFDAKSAAERWAKTHTKAELEAMIVALQNSRDLAKENTSNHDDH